MDHNGAVIAGGRFTYSVVAAPLHDADTVATLTAPVRALLAEIGGRPGAVDDDWQHPHLFVVATGGTERALLDLVRRRNGVPPAEPTVLLAHGAHNSLPAALEALAALHQQGARGRVTYLAGVAGDRDLVERAVVDLETVHRLRATRLGLVGGPSDWLVASSPSPELVRRRWGPEIELIVPERIAELDPSRSPDAVEFAAQFDHTGATVTDTAIEDASTIGTALNELVAVDELDAVSVRCFDLLHAPGTSGCLALASLNEHGVVAGCEGDIPSTLAMLWVRLLLDQPSWMANPARVDVDRNELVLAHCTIAPSMAESYRLETHFESGIGVGIHAQLAPQPVTLVRIGGRALDQCWIAEGRILASGDDACLCRTQVTIELDDRWAGELLARPLGNHLVLVRGHHRERLEDWWELVFGA